MNLKTSEVGNKKQKQNNVDHSSQLLLTQGVLCNSRRRKKIASVRAEQQRAYEFAWARSEGWASLASQLCVTFLLKHAGVCCQGPVPLNLPISRKLFTDLRPLPVVCFIQFASNYL